jgi:catechol 2,3-dioxygenase-like lactoylglutathione lyase family enzyme
MPSLNDTEAVATIAVKDLKTATKFYSETLGLKRGGREEPGGLSFTTGKTWMFVYQSSFAGTNKATAASWNVGPDLDATIKTLKGRGVVFEHYDMPGMKREGDVHTMGNTKAAWFKDPDGNILALLSA